MGKSILIAVAALIVSASSALAAGPYLGANIGFGIIHDSDVEFSATGYKSQTLKTEFDTGFAFDLAAGYKFNENIRAEGEFGYLSADVDKVDGETAKNAEVRFMTFMANGYYDITQLKIPVIPFVGVGMGLLHGKMKNDNGSDTDITFGYQLMAGASYAFNKNISADLRYRLQGVFSDFEFEEKINNVKVTEKFPYMSSSFLAGIRYNF